MHSSEIIIEFFDTDSQQATRKLATSQVAGSAGYCQLGFHLPAVRRPSHKHNPWGLVVPGAGSRYFIHPMPIPLSPKATRGISAPAI